MEAKAERVAVNKELLKLHTITDEAIERISELMDKYKETAEEDKDSNAGSKLRIWTAHIMDWRKGYVRLIL